MDVSWSRWRWSWERAKSHRARYWVSAVVLGALVGFASSAVPSLPSWWERGLVGFGAAVMVSVGIAILTFWYAYLRAPGEQLAERVRLLENAAGLMSAPQLAAESDRLAAMVLDYQHGPILVREVGNHPLVEGGQERRARFEREVMVDLRRFYHDCLRRGVVRADERVLFSDPDDDHLDALYQRLREVADSLRGYDQ